MRHLAAAVTILALAMPADAWSADVALTQDPTATNLSWGNFTLAWSRQAPDGTGRLVGCDLRKPAAGLPPPVCPRDWPVPPSNSLFDPDVEASPIFTSIVYTRCGFGGRNCDIFKANSRREQKVAGASSARCSEFAPSLWQRRIVFGRSGPRGCRGLYIARPGGSVKRLDSRVPADTDVWGSRAAFLYIPASKSSTTEIRLVATAGGRSRLLVAGPGQEDVRSRVSNPVLRGRFLYWLEHDLRRNQFLVGRTRGHRRSVIQFSDRTLPGDVDSVALGEGPHRVRTYYTNGMGVFRASPSLRFSVRD
jgi:hypothetical protein